MFPTLRRPADASLNSPNARVTSPKAGPGISKKAASPSAIAVLSRGRRPGRVPKGNQVTAPPQMGLAPTGSLAGF